MKAAVRLENGQVIPERDVRRVIPPSETGGSYALGIVEFDQVAECEIENWYTTQFVVESELLAALGWTVNDPITIKLKTESLPIPPSMPDENDIPF